MDVNCTKEATTTNARIGVDLGLKTFATDSNGKRYKPLKVLGRFLKKFRKKSRCLSKRLKGSKNRRKARKKLGKLHRRIADKRQDYLHKLNTSIVRENQVIAPEDLHVRGMMANSRLSRSIGDAGWSEFSRQIEYKSKWYRRDLHIIGRYEPTSKTCYKCGHIKKDLVLSVRSWQCEKCGIEHDSDINAARNILLTATSAGSACGASNKPKVAA